MSRIPRAQEHLKTGFTAEAVSAAKFRAYAERARRDHMPNLAAHWLRLAEEKDELARLQLDAAGKIRGEATDLGAAIADERYENEILYAKLIATAGDEEAGALFARVIERQKDHLARLEALRSELTSARADVELPRETAGSGSTAEASEPVTA